MRWNRGEWKGRQSPGIKPRTPGLCSQCSTTELQQLDNHQPSQSSICTAQVRLKCLSCTPDSHWVRFPVTAGLSLYFRLITSKFIPTWGKSSKQCPGCFVYLALGIHTVVSSNPPLKYFFSGDVLLSFQFRIWVSERDCHDEINTRGCPYMFVIRVKAVASHGDFCLVAVLFCPAAGTCTSVAFSLLE